MVTDIQQAASADIQEKIAEIDRLVLRKEELDRRGRLLMEERLENAVGLGQSFIDLKALVGHGEFMPAVRNRYGMSQDTVENYMLLAAPTPNSERVRNLQVPLRSAVVLANSAMPTTVIEMVATKQIPPTVKAIREAKRNVDNIPLDVPHISSKNNEWYTPAKYVDAARELMGGIELDPASCKQANETVKAARYYDISENGFDKLWEGKVWLNPPYGYSYTAGPDYGRSNQEIWSHRLIQQYQDGITKEAVLLVNAAVDTNWFHRLFDYPVCLTRGRINFTTPEPVASGSTHGSAFVYFGSHDRRFAKIFRQFGTVVRRW